MQASTQPMPTDLIDAATAAKRLRLHISTVFRWIQSKRLRAWKRRAHNAKQSRWFVSKADVDQCWEVSDVSDDATLHASTPATPATTAEESARLEAARNKLFGARKKVSENPKNGGVQS